MRKPIKDTVKRLKEIITVEPLLACYQMAQFISKPALDNLEFEKACRLVNTIFISMLLVLFGINFVKEQVNFESRIGTPGFRHFEVINLWTVTFSIYFKLDLIAGLTYSITLPYAVPYWRGTTQSTPMKMKKYKKWSALYILGNSQCKVLRHWFWFSSLDLSVIDTNVENLSS